VAPCVTPLTTGASPFPWSGAAGEALGAGGAVANGEALAGGGGVAAAAVPLLVPGAGADPEGGGAVDAGGGTSARTGEETNSGAMANVANTKMTGFMISLVGKSPGRFHGLGTAVDGAIPQAQIQPRLHRTSAHAHPVWAERRNASTAHPQRAG
jgi:hypothetical protein